MTIREKLNIALKALRYYADIVVIENTEATE